MIESSQVRLTIISKLEHMNQAIRIDRLPQSLLLVIVEITDDRHWMVQFAIIEFIPLLASQLGVAFCNDLLGALLYTIPVQYLVRLTHFTPKDYILMFWLFAHYPSLFKYPFAYFFINESGREKGQLWCTQKLDVRLWKSTAQQWLLVLGGIDRSSNNLLPPDMLLLLDLVFLGKSKVPLDIMFDSLIVHLDDFAHAIFYLTDDAMLLNEVVVLLGLLNETWSISSITVVCELRQEKVLTVKEIDPRSRRAEYQLVGVWPCRPTLVLLSLQLVCSIKALGAGLALQSWGVTGNLCLETSLA
ncbi:hypothetical protein K7X08_009331 [Anisodus acutangulus]|uniref:Uncharacterized protein n=1 Tax=Anisodus acutangulus TaxID=402998 RepID=A0A9Q1MZK7_9SOLA|nr:hypothetical protein K7X08_009331 [Anisodus acutangulus]